MRNRTMLTKRKSVSKVEKIKNDELTMENIVEPNSKDDQIFNQITTKEINEEENIDQIKYYEAQLIHEKIKASLNQIFSSIKLIYVLNFNYILFLFIF